MWAVDDQGPEALLARMYASPAQGAVADAAPVIQEEGQLLLPLFAHSWHSGLPSFFCCISGRFWPETPPLCAFCKVGCGAAGVAGPRRILSCFGVFSFLEEVSIS